MPGAKYSRQIFLGIPFPFFHRSCLKEMGKKDSLPCVDAWQHGQFLDREETSVSVTIDEYLLCLVKGQSGNVHHLVESGVIDVQW